MSYNFGPDAARLYGELTTVLQKALGEVEAADAIGCLDALLAYHYEDAKREFAPACRCPDGAVPVHQHGCPSN